MVTRPGRNSPVVVGEIVILCLGACPHSGMECEDDFGVGKICSLDFWMSTLSTAKLLKIGNID